MFLLIELELCYSCLPLWQPVKMQFTLSFTLSTPFTCLSRFIHGSHHCFNMYDYSKSFPVRDKLSTLRGYFSNASYRSSILQHWQNLISRPLSSCGSLCHSFQKMYTRRSWNLAFVVFGTDAQTDSWNMMPLTLLVAQRHKNVSLNWLLGIDYLTWSWLDINLEMSQTSLLLIDNW